MPIKANSSLFCNIIIEKSKLKKSLLAAKADATAHLTHKRKQSESEECEPASKRRRVEEQDLMIRKTEFNQVHILSLLYNI